MRQNNIILRTLIAAAVITASYAGLVQLYHPQFDKAPSTALTNQLYVENYVCGIPAPTVLAGSSLTQRLPGDVLGAGFQSLALSGGGALTGVSIAVKSANTPRRILIEINKIDRGLDDGLIDQTFAEPLYTLRCHVAVLRAAGRPMTYFYGLLRGRTGGQTVDTAPALNAGQIRDVTADTAHNDSVLLPRDILANDVKKLVALVTAARARGIEPVLYEMPVEPNLTFYPRPAQIRAAVLLALPPSQICWLDMRLPGGAHTFDGEHLEAADSIALAKMLRAGPPCRKD